MQETFAHVLRKPRFLRSEDDLGYLLRVLRNTYVSTRRRAERRPQESQLDEDAPLPDPRRAGQPEAQLERRELYAAVAGLPDNFRDALVAVDLVGLSYREAARMLRVREATLTTRLHRGRRALGEALRGGGSGPGSEAFERGHRNPAG